MGVPPVMLPLRLDHSPREEAPGPQQTFCSSRRELSIGMLKVPKINTFIFRVYGCASCDAPVAPGPLTEGGRAWAPANFLLVSSRAFDWYAESAKNQHFHFLCLWVYILLRLHQVVYTEEWPVGPKSVGITYFDDADSESAKIIELARSWAEIQRVTDGRTDGQNFQIEYIDFFSKM
jgi:hypothetical protein